MTNPPGWSDAISTLQENGMSEEAALFDAAIRRPVRGKELFDILQAQKAVNQHLSSFLVAFFTSDGEKTKAATISLVETMKAYSETADRVIAVLVSPDRDAPYQPNSEATVDE